jgi:DNA (cytosine-5)-methyltransferase 1
MNELELFAGAGGGILGSQLIGHRTVCAVEYDAYARSVLLARQTDGTFPHFPVWDDVRTFDGKPWRGVVDVVSGGFPCQDISVAGRGVGLDGERSGLWGEMARIIGEVRPRYAFIENSPALVSRGLDRVLSDLAALGFDARWTVLGAADVGSHHQRDRIWILAHSRSNGRRVGQVQHIRGGQATPDAGTDGSQGFVAHSDSLRELQPQGSQQDERGRPCHGCGYVFDQDKLGFYGCPNCEGDFVADTDSAQREGNGRSQSDGEKYGTTWGFDGWEVEPAVGRVVDGMAHRAHRLKAIGNGQVPQCRAAAWQLLNSK